MGHGDPEVIQKSGTIAFVSQGTQRLNALFCVGRESKLHGLINKRIVTSFQTRLPVCEGIERVFAVVGAHATVANAAEGKVGARNVENRVVESGTSAWHLSHEHLLSVLLGAEHVESEGSLSLINKLNGIHVIFDIDDGQNGSENLFRHDFALLIHIHQDGRLHPLLIHVVFPSDRHFPPVQVARKAFHVPRRHDPAQILRLPRILAVPLPQDLLRRPQELLLHLLRAKDVVRGDARLPEVDQLPPQDPLGGRRHVHRVVIERARATSSPENPRKTLKFLQNGEPRRRFPQLHG